MIIIMIIITTTTINCNFTCISTCPKTLPVCQLGNVPPSNVRILRYNNVTMVRAIVWFGARSMYHRTDL